MDKRTLLVPSGLPNMSRLPSGPTPFPLSMGGPCARVRPVIGSVADEYAQVSKCPTIPPPVLPELPFPPSSPLLLVPSPLHRGSKSSIFEASPCGRIPNLAQELHNVPIYDVRVVGHDLAPVFYTSSQLPPHGFTAGVVGPGKTNSRRDAAKASLLIFDTSSSLGYSSAHVGRDTDRLSITQTPNITTVGKSPQKNLSHSIGNKALENLCAISPAHGNLPGSLSLSSQDRSSPVSFEGRNLPTMVNNIPTTCVDSFNDVHEIVASKLEVPHCIDGSLSSSATCRCCLGNPMQNTLPALKVCKGATEHSNAPEARDPRKSLEYKPRAASRKEFSLMNRINLENVPSIPQDERNEETLLLPKVRARSSQVEPTNDPCSVSPQGCETDLRHSKIKATEQVVAPQHPFKVDYYLGGNVSKQSTSDDTINTLGIREVPSYLSSSTIGQLRASIVAKAPHSDILKKSPRTLGKCVQPVHEAGVVNQSQEVLNKSENGNILTGQLRFSTITEPTDGSSRRMTKTNHEATLTANNQRTARQKKRLHSGQDECNVPTNETVPPRKRSKGIAHNLPVPLQLHILGDFHDENTLRQIERLAQSTLYVKLNVLLFSTAEMRSHITLSARTIANIIHVPLGNGEAIQARIAFKAGVLSEKVWVERAKHLSQGFVASLSPRIVVLHQHPMFMALNYPDFIDVISPEHDLTAFMEAVILRARNEISSGSTPNSITRDRREG